MFYKQYPNNINAYEYDNFASYGNLLRKNNSAILGTKSFTM